jgi:DNA-binding response OmpR family regulator
MKLANTEAPPDMMTILVVEDDPLILGFETAILKRAGYYVFSAADGIDGAALFSRHYDEIDALVTDISLPGMRGLEFAEFARKVRSDLRVLFASGSMEEEEALSRVKMAGYLAKPFTSEQLLSAVSELFKADVTRLARQAADRVATVGI